jgi:hypothetical protein
MSFMKTSVTKLFETLLALFYLSIISYKETCGRLENQVITTNMLSVCPGPCSMLLF